jgi:hypothetical protein
MTVSKYYWNPETINHFQFMSSYLSGEDVLEIVQDFVSVDCTIEDDDNEELFEEELVIDLIRVIYNESKPLQ